MFSELIDLLFGATNDAPSAIYKELEKGDWVRQGPCQIGGPDLYSKVVRRRQDLDGLLGDDFFEFQPKIYVHWGGRQAAADGKPFVQMRALVVPVEGPPSARRSGSA